MSFSMNLESRKQALDKYDLKQNKNFYFCSALANYKPQGETINVLIEDGLKELQIVELMLKHNLKHIIQNSFQSIDDKVKLINEFANEEKNYFDQNLDLLSNHNFKRNLLIKPDGDRLKIVNDLLVSMQLDPNSQRTQFMQEILHELIMNAQLSAPQMSSIKKPLDSFLKVEKNENSIAFSMIDFYGSLNINRFLKKIQAALLVGLKDAINYTSIGGAGLGSSIIYRNADSLFIGCLPNKLTKVSVIMPLNMSEKKIQLLQKSLHVFDYAK